MGKPEVGLGTYSQKNEFLFADCRVKFWRTSFLELLSAVQKSKVTMRK